jgi:hypothetical protein
MLFILMRVFVHVAASPFASCFPPWTFQRHLVMTCCHYYSSDFINCCYSSDFMAPLTVQNRVSSAFHRRITAYSCMPVEDVFLFRVHLMCQKLLHVCGVNVICFHGFFSSIKLLSVSTAFIICIWKQSPSDNLLCFCMLSFMAVLFW